MPRLTIALVGAMLALAAAAEGEFAFSYRFRIDPGADTQPVAFGLKHLAHPCLAEAPFCRPISISPCLPISALPARWASAVKSVL